MQFGVSYDHEKNNKVKRYKKYRLLMCKVGRIREDNSNNKTMGLVKKCTQIFGSIVILLHVTISLKGLSI